MNTATLLEWHYMIFLMPFGIAALLLLLSSLRIGHHHGGHAGGHGLHGHAGAPGHVGGHAAHVGHAGGGASHGHAHGATTAHSTASEASTTHPANGHSHANATYNRSGTASSRSSSVSPVGLLLTAIGAGRAPLPMVLEAFGLGWGAFGCFANQVLLNTPTPSPIQMLPSLGVALAGGFVGARAAAEILARLLPPEESLVVSRDALFGMTGLIAFPVSTTTGRIHIYDEYSTLHDEMCRVVSGHPGIEKGHKALVVDVDRQGNLIVEEIPDGVG